MADDHRPDTPVVPHGDGDLLDPHGSGVVVDPHEDGDPLDPHDLGNLVDTDDHGDPGILLPGGAVLLATDPPPGKELLTTERGEVFLVELAA